MRKLNFLHTVNIVFTSYYLINYLQYNKTTLPHTVSFIEGKSLLISGL